MHPELWTIPLINYPIRSYGFMLMIGFLTGIYWAAKRGEKVRANPDLVINLGFFALIGGVLGARLMYVIHYWKRDFAMHSNPFMALIDISSGGMEFFGGVVGGFALIAVYLLWKKESFRLYFDILTPAVMWGLAFGRAGCFLNGCCWGGLATGTVAENWAVQFPFASPAYFRQYENRQIKTPPQLLTCGPGGCRPLSRSEISFPFDKWDSYHRQLTDAEAKLNLEQKTDSNSAATRSTQKRVDLLKKLAQQEEKNQAFIKNHLQRFPSTEFPGQTMTPTELVDLAKQCRTLPVHPTQLYDIVNALLGCLFLSWYFRIRRRHGMVFAVWLMTYPWTRLVLELIRVDNPKDTFGLTVSQSISIAMLVSGLVLWLVIRKLPEISPAAKPWEPPLPDAQK